MVLGYKFNHHPRKYCRQCQNRSSKTIILRASRQHLTGAGQSSEAGECLVKNIIEK
jgi:hypothetical protein